MKKLLFETIGPAIIDIIGAFLPIKRFYEWRTYTIKKGKHKGFRWWTRSAHYVRFAVDMRGVNYDFLSLGNDKFDINKLYGITTSKIHQYSFRIGFRVLREKIEYFAYWYINGKRGNVYLGGGPLHVIHTFRIFVSRSYASMEMEGSEAGVVEMTMPEDAKLGNLYKSYPYFGGQKVCPDTIKIKIKEIE